MAKKIISFIVASLGSLVSIPLMKELIIFLISMGPVLELRGGLLAALALEMDPVESYIICVIGNIIPIPFILWLVTKILNYMRNSKRKVFNAIARSLDKKVEKHKKTIEKYGYLGVVLFVGIPLPGTGAWTGCLVASVLELDKKKSFISAVIGVLLASIIMMMIWFVFKVI